MRHRLQRKVFDGGKSPQNPRASSTFTIKQQLSRNPHSTKTNKLHSKSTYFYNNGSSRLSSKLNYVVPSVCTLALLIGGIIVTNPSINSTAVFATEPTDRAATPALSLALKPGETASQTTEAQAGTIAYRTNTFTVSSQQYKAYSIYVSGINGQTSNLIGKQNHSNIITGVGSNVAADGSFPDNRWGYAVSSTIPSDINAFVPTLKYTTVPNYSSTIPEAFTHIVASPNTASTQDFLISFATKFGTDMPEDNYQTNVMLSVVGDPSTTVNYSISYNANSGTNAPTDQNFTDDSGAQSYTTALPTAVPTRTGYSFQGWATTSSSSTAQYQPGMNVTIQNTSPNLTLYAVWKTAPFSGITTMQEMTKTVCDAATVGTEDILEDTRDRQNGVAGTGKRYFITKLADTNCWMTQNLDYDGMGTRVQDLALWDGGTGSGHVSVTTLAYYDPGAYYYANGKTKTPIATASHQADLHYSIGNYYSYGAAIKVCPSGWNLANYEKIFQKYNINSSNAAGQISTSPLFFVLGGSINKNLIEGGTSGNYWNWTLVLNTDNPYRLTFNDTSYSTSYLDATDSRIGMSVRCQYGSVGGSDGAPD